MTSYTHEAWHDANEEPSNIHGDLYLSILFNVINGDFIYELIRFIDGNWYGVPENYEVDGWVPYNPPPHKDEMVFLANDNRTE